MKDMAVSRTRHASMENIAGALKPLGNKKKSLSLDLRDIIAVLLLFTMYAL